MNFEYFIAKRLITEGNDRKKMSVHVTRIAIIGVALGMIVMILSVAIVTGFKKEIREKVIGFGSHITITNFDTNISFETTPIDRNFPVEDYLKDIEGIKHVQVYAIKPGIIKKGNVIEGIILKGIANDFDWSFFRKNIRKGHSFRITDTTRSDSILISQKTASLLKLDTGDAVRVYFPQDPPRMRRFFISGIYETGLEEFDKMFALVDIQHIQRLYDWSNKHNNWSGDSISGFEILLEDYDNIDAMTEKVFEAIGYQFTADGSALKIRNIKETNPQIFDWLDLTDTNVWVILILMTIVAGFNMISAFLVIVLERVNMIGIFKAIGSQDNSIRKIFRYFATFLIGRGLIWGNIIGLLVCLIQYKFEFIPLDPASYYVDTVPVNINIFYLVLLNTGTIIITYSMLIIPSLVISRISPVKAIRFN